MHAAIGLRQPLDRQHQPPRRRERPRRSIGQPRLDQPVRHHALQVRRGLGLHPWFPKPAGTTLSFAARGAHQRDALGLPLAETAPQPAFAAAAPQPLDHLPWFDGCFSDWSPRRARICWPDRKAALVLAGEGAFRHLHVYVPDDRAVLCAEPVSHLPDAVNRPDLGPTAQMTLLARGQSLSGSLILSALPLCPQPSPSLPQEVPA